MTVKNLNKAEKSSVGESIDQIIKRAVGLKATYLHIEPDKEKVGMRLRVNGLLRDFGSLPKARFSKIVDRLKTLANLNPSERMIPQEGRFKLDSIGKNLSLSVSILPTIDGEKVTIHILDEMSEVLSLSQLGYYGKNLSDIRETMAHDSGLILVSGPADSGKSTSMISMLSLIDRSARTVFTLEDKVEQRLPGTLQTQINPRLKLNFATGLASILRQDANVIMLSGLADSKTAGLVFRASRTNKLILSGLVENSISKLISRLKYLGIDRNSIGSSLKLLTNQRLMRKLCSKCRVEVSLDQTQIEKLKKMFDIESRANISLLNQLENSYVSELKDPGKTELSTTSTRIKKFYRASEDGCKECESSGYEDRIGVFEVVKMSDKLQSLISTDSDWSSIYAAALRQGTIPLIVDALVKSLAGQVSFDDCLKLLSSPL
ncbi:MAG TPA: ATPase, T2SS/T4P/T4SS family [Candidatus Saccharimonadales bacterium]|nr:ATPase, T2SS/T4P/T4SS family [Candidatus Saccharimonadales bacterium]